MKFLVSVAAVLVMSSYAFACNSVAVTSFGCNAVVQSVYPQQVLVMPQAIAYAQPMAFAQVAQVYAAPQAVQVQAYAVPQAVQVQSAYVQSAQPVVVVQAANDGRGRSKAKARSKSKSRSR